MRATEIYNKKKEESSVKAEEEPENENKLLDMKKQAVKKDYSSLDGDIGKKRNMSSFVKLLYVIAKNYRLLIRSRTSALVFLLGPLLIMSLVSVGFNTSSFSGVTLAAYSEGYSPLSEGLVANLSGNDYKIEKVTSREDCIDSVKLGKYPVCLVFPKDMVMDNSARNNIMIYLDESRINIANAISEKLSATVSQKASELSSGVISQMLGALDTINKEAEAGKGSATRLTTDNLEQITKLADALSKIEAMDFAYETVDTGVAATAVDSLKASKNLSSTDVTDVISGINTVVSGYNTVTSKINSLKDKAAEVQENTQGARSKASSNTPVIKDVNTRIDNIKTSVQGVKITNVEAIVSPLKISLQPLAKTKSYFVYILPTLLILLIMFVSLLMSATGVIREKESSAQLRNFITPTSKGTFLLAHYITYISIILLQVAIMFGVTRIFVSGIPITAYLLGMALLVVFATIFIFIGLFIGSMFNTGESATVASLSVGLITLLFSNAMLPLETLTGFLRTIVEYNPFVMVESMLKGLFLFDTAFTSYINLYIMLGFIVAASIATIIIQTMREKLLR